jgi:hypothetical protein
LFCIQPGKAAPFYIVGKLHCFFAARNPAPFTAPEGRLGLIDGGKNFSTTALANFPQGKSFPQSVFLTGKAASLDGFLNKSFLVVGELYLHGFQPLNFSVKEYRTIVHNSSMSLAHDKP